MRPLQFDNRTDATRHLTWEVDAGHPFDLASNKANPYCYNEWLRTGVLPNWYPGTLETMENTIAEIDDCMTSLPNCYVLWRGEGYRVDQMHPYPFNHLSVGSKLTFNGFTFTSLLMEHALKYTRCNKACIVEKSDAHGSYPIFEVSEEGGIKVLYKITTSSNTKASMHVGSADLEVVLDRNMEFIVESICASDEVDYFIELKCI